MEELEITDQIRLRLEEYFGYIPPKPYIHEKQVYERLQKHQLMVLDYFKELLGIELEFKEVNK